MAERKPTIPTPVKYAIAIAIPVMVLSFTLAYKARMSKSSKPRLHFFQDMDAQPKLKAQAGNLRYADGRAMRPNVPGTVARGQLNNDEHLNRGYKPEGFWIHPAQREVDKPRQESNWYTTYPDSIKVDESFVQRGRERYDIFCATCHGLAGYGDGPIQRRTEQNAAVGWVQPTNLHLVNDQFKKLEYGPELNPPGRLFNTITNGIRTMPAYASQISAEDRWAIVAYVRALQLSQNASIDAVPDTIRTTLKPVPAPDGDDNGE